MSPTSMSSARSGVPSRSRLVRKITAAPRSLRVVESRDAADKREARAASAASPRGSERDHQSFELACMPHQAELFGVAMRTCRDPDAAKDLVQETLLRAMCAWGSFQEGSNLRAWLFRILTNAFINGYRKRRRHQRFASERPGDALAALYGRDHGCTDDVQQTLFGDELCDEVKAALGRLGPEYRDVVERADLRGEKYRDIADALEVPIGTVMSRLHRGRRNLRHALEAYAVDRGFNRAEPSEV
jgi:RNA polymerase sigma-70 factor (ECF subfamily)